MLLHVKIQMCEQEAIFTMAPISYVAFTAFFSCEYVAFTAFFSCEYVALVYLIPITANIEKT